VRVLHATPPFPAVVDYLSGVQSLIGAHRASGLLDPAATDALFAHYAGSPPRIGPRPATECPATTT